jgi:hypothetical protein
MNKIFFIYRLNLRKKFIWCVFNFSLIFLPCFLQSDSLAWERPVISRVVETQDIIKTVIPHFGGLSCIDLAVPPDIVFKKDQFIKKFSSRSPVLTVPENRKSCDSSDNRTDCCAKKCNEEISPIQGIVLIVFFILSPLISIAIAIDIYLTIMQEWHMFF